MEVLDYQAFQSKLVIQTGDLAILVGNHGRAVAMLAAEVLDLMMQVIDGARQLIEHVIGFPGLFIQFIAFDLSHIALLLEFGGFLEGPDYCRLQLLDLGLERFDVGSGGFTPSSCSSHPTNQGNSAPQAPFLYASDK